MPEEIQFDFSNFLTDNARGSLEQADMLARSLGSPYIGTEHLLLGVLSQGESVGARILTDAGVTFERARNALNLTPRSIVVSTGRKGLSETAKLTLRMSWEVAQEFRQDVCGTEHILFSLLSQKNARATVLLRDMNVAVNDILEQIELFLERQSNEAQQSSSSSERHSNVPTKERTALGKFGVDITARAKRGELDPVIGREKQIARLVTVLSRRTKNNPILIGEPGVGKTAIVEGLAQRIVDEDVPAHLLDKRLIMLDVSALIAGTKYRGEFEQRLKSVLDEASSDRDCLLFIDELHLIVGAGAAEGSMDAANILKPSLARGSVRLIGATTLDEYRKHIEKDAAFERRLQPIVVPESTTADTKAILKGLKSHYEAHHGVSVSDEIIDEVVYMAERYIQDRFMPDKALDVLDEAAALLRVKYSKPASKERELQKDLRHLSERMEAAVEEKDYEKAALYKMRISRTEEQLKKLTGSREVRALDSQTVARAVSDMSGVPVMKLQKTEAGMYKQLEKVLAKHIVGQSPAIASVARAIRRSRSGVASGKRPIGSFVFMGPTGVGKTELAKVLAREVFGSEKSLIKIDMSEFGERHTASRLIGAPAGYVGYDDGGQLTDKIRRQPYSVVLFDEIEKAHRDVFQLLLQLLEDGALSDAKGRRVDFTNTIVILTSNLGAEKMQHEASLGFAADTTQDEAKLEEAHKQTEAVARKALADVMRPELIARFDDIVVFHALTKQDVRKIFDLLVDDIRLRLHRKGFGLTVSPVAKRLLIERGYDPKNGARPLRRTLQDEVEHMIAEGILDGRWTKGDILTVTAKRGMLGIEVTHESKPTTSVSTAAAKKTA